jgi:uncharacterized protein DUF4333
LETVDVGTGIRVRRRTRRRTRTFALAAALPAVLLALGGCGASGYDTGALAKDIKTRLDQHPGWTVRSVSCPDHARLAKGVVIRCSATLSGGHVVHLRATQLDDKGAIHLVANELFADNVERGIVAALPVTATTPRAVCPNHVPVVIGNAFTCTLTHGGRYSRARVTIVDGDGGFRLSFS